MNDKKINRDFNNVGVPKDGVKFNCMTMISSDFQFLISKNYLLIYKYIYMNVIIKL